MSIAGGNPPQRPDQQLQPRSRAGSGPGPQQTVFSHLTIVPGGSITIGSGGSIIVGAGGTIDIGSGGAIMGTDWILNQQGYFQYAGTPAAGNLIQSFAPTFGTDAFGNPYAGSAPITQFITANGQTFNSNESYFIRTASGTTGGNWTRVAATTFEHITTNPFSLTPVNVGDLILLAVMNNSNNTVEATSLASTNVTWTNRFSFDGVNNAKTGTIFAGQATAASAANVTITWSGAAPAAFATASEEFTSSGGAGAWSFNALEEGKLDAAAGTASWPLLTPGNPNELYFGYGIPSSANTAGSTPGFSYVITAGNNSVGFDPTVTGAITPVWGSAVERFAVTIMATATGAGTANFINLKMAAGTWDGQPCQIYDTSSAGSLTFNPNPALSLVADAALGDVISPLSGAGYVWSKTDHLWYPL